MSSPADTGQVTFLVLSLSAVTGQVDLFGFVFVFCHRKDIRFSFVFVCCHMIQADLFVLSLSSDTRPVNLLVLYSSAVTFVCVCCYMIQVDL